VKKAVKFFFSFLISVFIKSLSLVRDKVTYVRVVFKEMSPQAFVIPNQRIPILLSGFHVTAKNYYKRLSRSVAPALVAGHFSHKMAVNVNA